MSSTARAVLDPVAHPVAVAQVNVFGGFMRLPESPDADMHGMCRVIVAARLFSQAIVALERVGLKVLPGELGRYWTVTFSQVELEVAHARYGEVYTCESARAYLRPGYYHRHPRPGCPHERVNAAGVCWNCGDKVRETNP